MKKITFLILCIINYNAFSQAVFEEDFENETVDATTFAQWTSIDNDNDGNFWEVSDIGAYAVTNAPNHPIMSLAADSDSWEGSGFTPDNFLITSSAIDLSGVSGTQISFVVGSYQTNGTFTDDLYSVYLSTSNDPTEIINETPLTTRFVTEDASCDNADGSNSAGTVSLDASAYDGQSVYLTFRHYDTFDMNSVLIDDVAVGSNLSVEDLSINNFSYILDSTNMLKLSADNILKKVYIYNIAGKQVLNTNLNNYTSYLDLSSLSTGVYIARVIADNSSEKSIKLVVK
tara:strand:- start:66 stop:926 length:861 start_codon:yes stop_codon:yes gene_type:complete